ncbi:DivIVA domain-containing protein [Demequina sediminicola]|uniref:DivIVA domain-containing protein n=1 Tax=Demequina sediminicola TaxID=1095026 RepID=UPI000A55C0F5|nr:DivIVA domain-containing protein [Demequina sediminicola]
MAAKGMFSRVSVFKLGYEREGVEEFFSYARHAYENQAGAQQLDPMEVRRANFDLVHRGYSPVEVDAALDRLEVAFAVRGREQFVRTQGQDAWMRDLADRAQALYPRLRRPAGERFAHPGAMSAGYDASEVDATLDRLIAFFDKGEQVTPDELRNVMFKRKKGRKAYSEAVVDAYLARAVDILLGAT